MNTVLRYKSVRRKNYFLSSVLPPFFFLLFFGFSLSSLNMVSLLVSFCWRLIRPQEYSLRSI